MLTLLVHLPSSLLSEGRPNFGSDIFYMLTDELKVIESDAIVHKNDAISKRVFLLLQVVVSCFQSPFYRALLSHTLQSFLKTQINFIFLYLIH